jgi:hypothetical protein
LGSGSGITAEAGAAMSREKRTGRSFFMEDLANREEQQS